MFSQKEIRNEPALAASRSEYIAFAESQQQTEFGSVSCSYVTDEELMRVLYLHQYFVDPGGVGGTRSLEFGRRLVRDGHSVTMVTSTAALSGKYRSITRVTSFEIEGIQVVAIPVPYSNDMGRRKRILAFGQFALRSALTVLRTGRPDVVLATSTPLTIALPGALARVRHRVPLVLEVRDLWPEAPIQMGYLENPGLRLAARMLERFAYGVSAAVIALSSGMVDGVQRVVRLRKPVSLVPNAADTDVFGDSNVKPGDFTDSEQFTVLYSGTLGRANNVGWIVDVVDRIPPDLPLRVLIAGDGAERSTIEKDALRRGLLDNRIVFLGKVPKAEMPSLMASADICLSLFAPVPILETTSPNKFFDALAAGRAVALNYGGWQADIIEAHDCGIQLDRDPTVAAAQLLQLVADRQRVKAMGVRARALALAEFDRDTLYQRWVNVLESVARV